MKNEFAARSLNVAAFAIAGESHVGEERLARFDRLMEETHGLGGETLLSYQVQGELRPDAAGQDEPWLRLQAQATLPLICQRCMGPVDVPVQFEWKTKSRRRMCWCWPRPSTCWNWWRTSC
jgi:uncharacterized protein